MLEPLETRIAPAGVVVFTDVDGDEVTVRASKGTQQDLEGGLRFASSPTAERQLQNVFIESPQFIGTNLFITARQRGDGDGRVNVGEISCGGGQDYGTFIVDGDLGSVSGEPGKITRIDVRSLGMLGFSTQDSFSPSTEITAGKLDILTVGTNLAAAVTLRGDLQLLKVGGNIIGDGPGSPGAVRVEGHIATVSVRGTLLGGSTVGSGSIQAESFGTVTTGELRGSSGDFSGAIIAEDGGAARIVIKGDVVGGRAAFAQQIVLDGRGDFLQIDGSILGGTGGYAGVPSEPGQIFARNGFGDIAVRGDIVGNTANFSGTIVAGNDADATTPLNFSASGPIARVSIGGSLRGGPGEVSGGVLADVVGPVNIDGSIRGGPGEESGMMDFEGSARVTVGGDIQGGSGTRSGRLVIDNEDGSEKVTVLVRGSVLGGPGPSTGQLNASQGDFGNVTVLGRVEGAGGDNSGRVNVNTETGARFSIGGSIRGGAGPESGSVEASGENVKATFTVGGSIVAGGGPRSGFIEIDGINRTTVLGSLFGGADNAGMIRGTDPNGALVILGGVIGLTGPARIIGLGDTAQTPDDTSFNALAFKTIAVHGDVRDAQILIGYGLDPFTDQLSGIRADVSLGTLTVLGDWVRSDLAVGVEAGSDGNFGTGDDAVITAIPHNPAVLARLGSVVLGGAVLGTPGGTDTFAFVAELISGMRVEQATVTFDANPSNTNVLIGPTGDVRVREAI